MDCQTALELLETVRLDSDDLQQPELAVAGAHLGSCGHCRSVFASRQEIDRRLSQIMQRVPVPPELKGRLLSTAVQTRANQKMDSQADDARTEADGTSEVRGGLPGDGGSGRSRREQWRKWLYTAGAVAASLLGILAWQLSGQTETTVALQTLQQAVPSPSEIEQLPAFDGSFAARLPSGWTRHEGLTLSAPATWRPIAAEEVAAAVYKFHCRLRRRDVVGWLVVVPRSRVANAPAATVFGSTPVGYGQNAIGALAAWTESELVYVCLVQGGTQDLELLQSELALPTT